MNIFDAVKDHPVGPVGLGIAGFFVLGGPIGVLIGLGAGAVVSLAQQHFAEQSAPPDAFDQVLSQQEESPIQAAIDSGDPYAIGQPLSDGGGDDGSGGAMTDAEDSTDPDADSDSNYDGGGGGATGGGGSGSGGSSASGGGSAGGPATTPPTAPPGSAPIPGAPPAKIQLKHGVPLAHSTGAVTLPPDLGVKLDAAFVGNPLAGIKLPAKPAPAHFTAHRVAPPPAKKPAPPAHPAHKPAPKPAPKKPSGGGGGISGGGSITGGGSFSIF